VQREAGHHERIADIGAREEVNASARGLRGERAEQGEDLAGRPDLADEVPRHDDRDVGPRAGVGVDQRHVRDRGHGRSGLTRRARRRRGLVARQQREREPGKTPRRAREETVVAWVISLQDARCAPAYEHRVRRVEPYRSVQMGSGYGPATA